MLRCPPSTPSPKHHHAQVPTVYADVWLYDLRRNSWIKTTAVGAETLTLALAP